MQMKTNKKQSSNKKNGKLFIIIAAMVAVISYLLIKPSGYDSQVVENKIITTGAQQAEPEPIKVSTVQEETQEPTTARIDIITPLFDAETHQFEVYVDDAETPLTQEEWMLKYNTQGSTIQKAGNNANIMIKALNDADIYILLKGPWKQDNNNMAEHWIKYSSLIINGEEVLPESIDVWHNKPFKHIIDAKNGETYKIHVEWSESDLNRNN